MSGAQYSRLRESVDSAVAVEVRRARAFDPIAEVSRATRVRQSLEADIRSSKVLERDGLVQLGGNQQPAQKLLKRLTNLLATDARLYHPFVLRQVHLEAP